MLRLCPLAVLVALLSLPASAQTPPSAYPFDTVVTASGEAIVVDRNLPGLRSYKDNQLTILFQGSKKFKEPLNAARALALDNDGKLIVGDSATRDIYRLDDSGKPQPLTNGGIGTPMDIAVRKDGSLMVADVETKQLFKVSADGKEVKAIAKCNPRGVFVDKDDRVWVVSQDAQQLQIVGDDGQSKPIVEKRTFEFPHQVVVNEAGEAFVSDGYKKAIWKVVEGKAPEVIVSGAPLDNPVGLALSGDEIIVTDPRAAKVFRLKDGKLETWFEVK